MAVGILEKGDELWQYYTGVEVTHGVVDPEERSGIGGAYLLVQKRDRFVGARAGHTGGEIVTPPLIFAGNRLQINVDCGGLGEAWVGTRGDWLTSVSGLRYRFHSYQRA